MAVKEKETYEQLMARLDREIADRKKKGGPISAPPTTPPATAPTPVDPPAPPKAEVPKEEPKKEPTVEKPVEGANPVEAPKVEAPAPAPKVEEPMVEKPREASNPEPEPPAPTAPKADAPPAAEEKAKRPRKAKAEPEAVEAPATPVVSSKTGRILVHRTYTKDGEIVEAKSKEFEELIQVPEFVGPTAMVSCDYGMTINMGNYESAKVGVFVSVPCYVQEINEAFEFAKKRAMDIIDREATAIKDARDGK